jgi:tetratricopeptide (TPR) repeat protein
MILAMAGAMLGPVIRLVFFAGGTYSAAYMLMQLWFFGAVLLALQACAGSSTSFLAGRQALLRGEPDNAAALFEQTAQADPAFVATSAPPPKSIWTYLGRAHYNAGRYPQARAALDKALTYVKDDVTARLYRGLVLMRTQAPAPPPEGLTLQEVTYALREAVTPRRMSTLARERGVAFDLNAETENQLKNAGADAALLEDLKSVRAKRAKSTVTNDGQLNEGANEVAAGLTGLRDWLVSMITYAPQGRYWDTTGEIRAEITRGLKLTGAKPRDFAAILFSGELVGYKLEEESDLARRDEEIDRRRPIR